MTWGTNGEPDTDHPSSEELLVAAREFQAAHLAWELAATEEERAHRRTLLLLAYERLWPMLLSIVQPMARKWVRGHRIAHQLAGDWEQSLLSLATSYCLDIIEELPRLELKADQNIIGLFCKIAYRRMIDAERKRRRKEGGAARPPDDPSGAPPARPTFTTRALDEALMRSIPDAFSVEVFERVDNADYHRQLAEAIYAYWRSALSGHDHIIVELRLEEPPVPYDEIASQLGPSWTAAAVRQRYSRIRHRTLEHLRAIKLLSDA